MAVRRSSAERMDLIVNRGHYFGTDFREPGEPAVRPPGVSDAGKRALIEFLKTL